MPEDRPLARVYVIGPPGSGKTTLAHRLGPALGLPVVELDDLAFDVQANGRLGPAERLDRAKDIAVRERWVAEGVFLWWTETLLERADLIIWLDCPVRVTSWRIVRRHIVLGWKGENRHPGVWRMLKWVAYTSIYHYRRKPKQPRDFADDEALTRAATVESLRPHMAKVVRCRSSSDSAGLFAPSGLPREPPP
jgi:adenylate kinase family enzyme